MTEAEVARVRKIIHRTMARTKSFEEVNTASIGGALNVFEHELYLNHPDQIDEEIAKAKRDREARAMVDLRNLLSTLPEGDVGEDHIPRLAHFLSIVWHTLTGSDQESTEGSKIRRAEKFSWKSPTLKFILERHGESNRGFKRAATHYWEVNLEKTEAHIAKYGSRTRANMTWRPKDYSYDYRDLDFWEPEA
jgi:hypothetical protein